MRREPAYEPYERSALRFRKEQLAEAFQQADQFINPPKPLTTMNRAFRVGGKYPGQSITRSYDGHVWDVLKGHFERLPREKGQRTSFKIVAPLPEKDEYLQLKERHFTRTLESLVDDAYGIVDELQAELQDAYDNMPEGLQGSAVGEARMETASELENMSGDQPELPQSVSSLRIVHYPSLNQSSRRDRAYEAAAMLQAASGAVQAYRKKETRLKKADASELDEFCEQLDEHADQIESIEFPGMYG